jgi:MFS family permease
MNTITSAIGRPHPALLAVLLAAPFLATADSTITNVATPAVRAGLRASGSDSQFVIGGYTLAYAVLLIIGARLGQTYGYKRLFLVGVAAFGITSLADGLAPDIAVLIAMRVVQGGAAALMLPQVLTGIQLHFSGEHRARAVGLYAASMSLGAVVGQVLGGLIVSANIADMSWRPIFLVGVPVCLAALVGGSRVLPADEVHGMLPVGQGRARTRVDLPGVAALSASVLLLAVPLTIGPDMGWPAWSWAALGASMPAFGLFLAIERRALAASRRPLVDPTVLARPAIAWALVALLASSGTYFALLFTLAQYLQAGLGRSALFSGLILVPWVAAFGLAGQARRYFPARFIPAIPVIGFALIAAVYLAISGAVLTGHLSTPLLAAAFLPGGFGLGLLFTGLIGHLTSAASREHASDISGITATTSQIGGSLGVAGFGTLYLTLAATASPGRGFGLTALAFGATALLAAMPAYLATRRRPEAAPSSAGRRDRRGDARAVLAGRPAGQGAGASRG